MWSSDGKLKVSIYLWIQRVVCIILGYYEHIQYFLDDFIELKIYIKADHGTCHEKVQGQCFLAMAMNYLH